MLSSKLFSLLAFTAAVVSRGFPHGEFLISNIRSQLVLEGSLTPGDPIVLSSHSKGNDVQVWSYINGTGFLENKASGLVIEVPRMDGEIQYGTELVQAARRNETNDDLVQLWDYDDNLQHLFTLADTTACVAGNSSEAPVMVDYCDGSGEIDSQQWEFISTKN